MGKAVILGRKIGMSQIFDESGRFHPVTVVQAGPCFVVQVKTKESDGYEAVKLGFDPQKKKHRLRKPQAGEFKKAGVEPVKVLREFRGVDLASFQVGQEVKVDTFEKGDVVRVTGTSKGKGFQGVVKRHHFAGGPRTHGQSDRHRAPGSIGSSAYPSRVVPGRRMAGHMGNERTTTKNLRVLDVDAEHGLLVIRGTVPGHRHTLLQIETDPAKKTKTKAES